jgi:hypothetical protein
MGRSRRREITMPIADEGKLLASPAPALYRVHHGIAKKVQAGELLRQSLLIVSKLGRETSGKKPPVLLDDFGEVDKRCIRKDIVDWIRIIFARLYARLSYLRWNTLTPPLCFCLAEFLYQRLPHHAVKCHFRIGEILIEIAPENAWITEPTIEIQFVPLEALGCRLLLKRGGR